jgi:signal transduction histidine kinase
MAKVRDGGPWLVLAVLSVLLVVLGYLQYRWTHELGRAAAERLQTDLERTARRFAAALERELGQTAIAFFTDAGPTPSETRALLAERLEEWHTRENGGLVSGLLLATRTDKGRVVLEEAQPGDDAFHELAWPEPLRPLAARLAEGDAPGPGSFPIRPGSVIEKPLAIVLPVFGAPLGPRPGAVRSRLSIGGVVLVRLDEGYLRNRLLPRLAEASFGSTATTNFDVAILRRSDRSVFYASEPDAATSGKRDGDVELVLPGRGRGPGAAAEAREPGPPPGPPPGLGPGPERPGGAPPRLGRRPGEDDGPWLLVARHRGGSFEAAVARVQQRNLATGFGVLALLGATVLVLVASAQRASRLARQQLEFVTGVTHELNTPLAAIRSAGQNLAAGIVTDAAQVRRYGDLIEKEGGRLTALVTQVLDFAGIESQNRPYTMEPLAVGTLVDEVLQDHALVLQQAGLTLERDVTQPLPAVRGDATALKRVLSNLIANAVKFAGAGGSLAVRASARGDGRAVVLRVEDRGPGIAREERERVFEPFYRGPAAERNRAPGSGLGLSLVRRVVRAHGGSVRAEAREGGGASLVVELPAAPAEEPAA